MTMNARFCRVLFSEFSLLSVTIFAITLVARKAIGPLCVCLCDDGRTKSSFSCMCIFGTAVQLDLVCIKFKSQDHRAKSKVAERICPF